MTATSDATTQKGKLPVPSVRHARVGLGPRGGIVTREAVFEAAEELDAKFGRATMHGVRSTLGGGSMTPIAEHLRAYRAAKLQAAAASPEDLLTTPLREAFVVALGNAQAEARKACAAELAEGEAQRRELMEAVADMEDERNRLRDQVDELEAAMTELREQAARQKALHREHDSERDGTLTALTQDRDEARKSALALQMQHAASEAARKQAESVVQARETERRQIVEMLEAERRARADADKALAVAGVRASAHKEASERMERELERGRELTRQLRASLERLRGEQREEERAAHKLALESAETAAKLRAEQERIAHLLEQQAQWRSTQSRATDKPRKSKEMVP